MPRRLRTARAGPGPEQGPGGGVFARGGLEAACDLAIEAARDLSPRGRRPELGMLGLEEVRTDEGNLHLLRRLPTEAAVTGDVARNALVRELPDRSYSHVQSEVVRQGHRRAEVPLVAR